MEIFSFIIHIDEHLANIINSFGGWTYAILFLIIFAETGFVLTPFLPGDSLLFAVGTLSGGGFLNIWRVYFIMLAAAVLGDTVNYWIGHFIGPKVFARENARFFKKEYLAKTHSFYQKYGGKTIVIARFVPIVRTFAPFVAGIGSMRYGSFLFYNIWGAFLWITSLTFAGYFFGGIPFIKANFEYVVFGIIAISLSPLIIEYIKHKRIKKAPEGQMKVPTFKDIQTTFEKEHLVQ